MYYILYYCNTEVFSAWSNHPKNHLVTNDDESWQREFEYTFKKPTRNAFQEPRKENKNECVSTDPAQKLTPLLL